MLSTGGETAFAAALLDPARGAPPIAAHACRFSIYRNNVVGGLVDAMAETFPAVLALVGEPFFRAAAREFVRAHPPRSPVLVDYGGAFRDWIGAFPPASGVPYLSDVARLEWAWSRAYNAAEAAALPVSALVSLSPHELAETRPILHPSVTVIVSTHPVVSLWVQSTGRAERSRLDLREPETALVARPADAVEVRSIDKATAASLAALARGMTLGEAMERAAECGGFEIETHIAGLFAMGLVVDVEDGGPGSTSFGAKK
ncbi:MAG: putative DNA-binding domain-containing protein [Hyphomicrobiaceae bacterium]